MSCRVWRSHLIEIGRGRLPASGERDGAMRHTRSCPDCRLFLEEQMALTVATAALARENYLAPPADLESVLLSEFLSRRLVHRSYKRLAPAAAIAVVAAALAWLVTMQRGHVSPGSHVPPPSVSAPETAAMPPVQHAAEAPTRKPALKPARRPSPKPVAEEAPFMAIPYTVPLEPWERATVVRMEMPATALAAVGLAVAVPDPRASAQTDVIVGEDGRIRAIRLLSISTSNSDRSINQ